MKLFQILIFTVTFLCLSKSSVGQDYDTDINSYNEYSSDGEDASPEDTGFVTPLDFSPLFGGSSYGLSGAASNPAADIFQKVPKQYQSLFNADASNSVGAGQDFFQGQSSDKQFSPESFGFLPHFSQGLAAESVGQPKRYQEKTVEIERTKATAKSSAITRNPLQFNIETKHNNNYQNSKPDINTAAKLVDFNSPSVQSFKAASRVVNEDQLTPYKKYTLQQHGPYVPIATKQALASAYPGIQHAHIPQALSIDPKNLRYKRYSGNKRKSKGRKSRQNEDSDEDDEYNYRSEYKSRPKEFDESDIYDSPDFSGYSDKANLKKYDYGSDEEYGSDEYEKIKSLSDKQAAELKQHPENCKQVQKDSMTCNVCVNPKTGGSYESCAYVSEPKNNKYAYVKEHKFDSNDQPENSEESKKTSNVEKPEKLEELKTAPYKQTTDKDKLQTYSGKSDQSSSKFGQSPSKRYTSTKPSRGAAKYKQSSSNKQIKQQAQPKFENYYSPSISPKAESSQPIKFAAYQQEYDNDDTDDEADDDEDESSDENENSDEREEDDKNEEYQSSIPGFFTNNEEKKDVESVLAEFATKDRSACKKIFKNHMTCYQCTDKSGMKHEECMFVSESAPKKSHLAYKEVKEFNSKPKNNNGGNEEAESKVVTSKPNTNEKLISTTESSTEFYQKIKKTQPLKKYNLDDNFKKVTPSTFLENLNNAKLIGSFGISSTVASKLNPPVKRNAQVLKRPTRTTTENQSLEDSPSAASKLDNIADPEDFAGAESRGAFWADTLPTYNKELGVALPKYMLEISEDEKNFDKSVFSGI